MLPQRHHCQRPRVSLRLGDWPAVSGWSLLLWNTQSRILPLQHPRPDSQKPLVLRHAVWGESHNTYSIERKSFFTYLLCDILEYKYKGGEWNVQQKEYFFIKVVRFVKWPSGFWYLLFGKIDILISSGSKVCFIHIPFDSSCPAKTPSTSSTTPSCPTTRRSPSETSRSTTPSAACTEQPTWWITPCSAKGKHPSETRGDRSHRVQDKCILTQWLAAFLLNPLLFTEWLQFMSTTGV